jgi:hypothetical protein
MFEAQQVFERRLEIQRQRLTVDRDLETGCAMHMGASLAGKSWQRQQTGGGEATEQSKGESSVLQAGTGERRSMACLGVEAAWE